MGVVEKWPSKTCYIAGSFRGDRWLLGPGNALALVLSCANSCHYPLLQFINAWGQSTKCAMRVCVRLVHHRGLH